MTTDPCQRPASGPNPSFNAKLVVASGPALAEETKAEPSAATAKAWKRPILDIDMGFDSDAALNCLILSG
jgi:hypothetical protein